MTNVAFKLQDSGFSREQVEALTEFMSGSVSTKEDIAHLRGEIIEDIAHLEGRIIALEGKVEAQGTYLEGKIEAQGERLEGRIVALESKMEGKINLLYWMFGVLVAGVGSLVIKTFFG